ncbi:hypothetical protein FRB90_009481 [Tulasnella sp. 427]|nr:hypothetical protein FRB90_009481 [Tulasnella sp. 427]
MPISSPPTAQAAPFNDAYNAEAYEQQTTVMNAQQLLTLAFAALWLPHGYGFPTQTKELPGTSVLRARLRVPTTSAADDNGKPKTPGQIAGAVITVVIVAFGFGFLYLKKKGTKFHCHGVKRVLARKSRGQHVAPPPSTTPAAPLPMGHHGSATGAPNSPAFASLDGWKAPATPQAEAVHMVPASAYQGPFSNLDGYDHQSPAHTQPIHKLPAEKTSSSAPPSVPPPSYPEQTYAADSWKQGTEAEADLDGWKQG